MADVADQGSRLEEQERQRAIHAATHRPTEKPLLDDNGNRICLDCEGSIPEGRMIANPQAVRCVSCQELYEGQGELRQGESSLRERKRPGVACKRKSPGGEG